MLVVHSHFHPRRTGVTAHTEEVVKALAPLCEVKVVGELMPEALPRMTLGELWRRAKREPVVFHAHRNNELLVALLFRALGRRLKIVYTSHNSRRPGRFTRLLVRFADALITLNQQGFGWIGRPSTVVHHGVSLDRFTPPADRAAAWRALGLPGAHGIGVVGRIREAKGQGDFVEAIAPLLERHPDWTPVLIGLAKPAEQRWLEGLQQRAGGRLQLPGEQRDVAPWYQGLSILVHPSYAEAFSMVLIEAMAAGCCVVVSKLPHVPAVVEHGRSGFLFEPGDVEGLRRILEELLADPTQVERVGRQAAEEAKARFGVHQEAQKLHAVYRALGAP